MSGAASEVTPDRSGLLPLARKIRQLSLKSWPGRPPVEFVGRSGALATLLSKVEKFAKYREPILILGESGCGKELLARACYLLGDRVTKQFVPVSCPQYTDSGNTISELFGHRKGSFTGAIADRTGLFESADGGVIFLDEIADLPLQAQVMMLRTLAEGEFRRLGDTQTRVVNTRVIAATNKSLEDLVVQKEFRHDLYFRLSYFPLHVPPLRERGDDWLLIADQVLDRLCREHGAAKKLSRHAVKALSDFPWPGNIRQLQAAVILGYSAADSCEISMEDMATALACDWFGANALSAAPFRPSRPHGESGEPATGGTDVSSVVDRLFDEMVGSGQSFWQVIREPFLNRDLNRAQAREVIDRGLQRCRGNYRKLVGLFNMPPKDYHKFMGFLRTHSLKVSDDAVMRQYNGGSSQETQ